MRNENIAELLESFELILVFQSSVCDRHLKKYESNKILSISPQFDGFNAIKNVFFYYFTSIKYNHNK